MKTLFLLISLAAALPAFSQTPSTVPMVLGCSNPAPAVAGKPTVFFTKCFTPVFVPTTSSSVIASVSKTAPVWAHSISAYNSTDLLVACPSGAIVSGSTCSDSTKKDISVVVAKSAIPSLTINPINPPGPDYSTITSYIIEQSYDAGKTWDTISTTITYAPQSLAHCFRITPHRKDGDGPSTVSCPLPKIP